MLNREFIILKWLFLVITLVMLALGGTMAVDPAAVVLMADSMFPLGSDHQHIDQHFTHLYHAFTLAYFCVLLHLSIRLWRNPEDNFRDLRTILLLLILPVLFTVRFFVAGVWGPLHLFIDAVFGSLFILLTFFEMRLRAALAQRHVFTPVKK